MTFSMRIMARELRAAVDTCAGVADRMGAIPVLAAIRIEISGGIASFMATNTQQTIVHRAACEGSGSICVDAGSLDMKVKTLRDGEVAMVADDKFLSVGQGRTKWKLPVILDDFPASLMIKATGDAIKLPPRFAATLSRVSASAHPEGSARAYLEGVCIDGDMMVATDASRMAVSPIGVSVTSDPSIIPIKACAKIASLDGEISIRIAGTSAIFETETVSIKTQLVDGTYPDWRRVVPDGHPHHVNVDRADLIASIKRASSTTADATKDRAAPMRLTIGDEIECLTRNAAGEEGVDYVACDRHGDEIAIGINAPVFLGAIESLTGEKIRVEYRDPTSAIKITSGDDVRVVMPYRLRGALAE